MQIPITLDQAFILVILGFAFRSYQRFDKAADKIDSIEKLWESGRALEAEVKGIKKDVENEVKGIKKDIENIRDDIAELKGKDK